ncbi:MAG: hypothetical protein OEX08_01505 [Candidatus Nomurabacteria bacterium]|nr:hypothetical protein [Candidatus Nomurabacteria bacterium]
MTIPNRSTILSFIKLAFITVLLVGGVVYVSAQWTGPTATPPNDNTPEPINAGGFPQTKLGQLTIGSSGALKNLFVFGNAHVNKSYANEFCLPGTNPAGGCIGQWPGGLPAGLDGYTLRHNGTNWIGDRFFQNNGISLGIGANPLNQILVRIKGDGSRIPLHVSGTSGNFHVAADGTTVISGSGSKLKYLDGQQGSGKVLTSDGSGNATWASLPAAVPQTQPKIKIKRISYGTNSSGTIDLKSKSISCPTSNPIMLNIGAQCLGGSLRDATIRWIGSANTPGNGRVSCGNNKLENITLVCAEATLFESSEQSYTFQPLI